VERDEKGRPVDDGVGRKATGVARVLSHTPEDYVAMFWLSFDRLKLVQRSCFTSEDIRDLIGDPPNHPNALSALMNAARARGRIEWTGRVGYSLRPSSRRAMLKFWRLRDFVAFVEGRRVDADARSSAALASAADADGTGSRVEPLPHAIGCASRLNRFCNCKSKDGPAPLPLFGDE
jgi:hypothetical protein